MHWLRSFLSRDRREREFERELQFHIDEVTRENMAHGMPHEEAYRQAMLEFGGKEQATQELRDVYAAASHGLKSDRSQLRASGLFAYRDVCNAAFHRWPRRPIRLGQSRSPE